MLKSLLWDVNLSAVDGYKHKRFIIERCLKFGRPEHIQWMRNFYSDDDIIEVVKKSKVINRKTANYWAIHFKIPKKEILCFNRPLIYVF